MPKKVEIELSGLDLKTTATILEVEEPEVSKLLWDELATPLEMICHHSQATGQNFLGKARPPRHPVKSLTYRNQVKICDKKPGDISYMVGRLGINVTYGLVTEEAIAPGPVAKAENLKELQKIGKKIWESYHEHTQLKLVMRRKESRT